MTIPPSIVDPNHILMTGENPFVRLASEDSDDYTTTVSFWRMTFCPAGPGHVLFARSELTDGQWRIYSDNPAMTRWLQQTIQGMLTPELKDESIAIVDATFEKSGDPLKSYTETIRAGGDELVCSWSNMRDPMMQHTQPGTPAGRPYGGQRRRPGGREPRAGVGDPPAQFIFKRHRVGDLGVSVRGHRHAFITIAGNDVSCSECRKVDIGVSIGAPALVDAWPGVNRGPFLHADAVHDSQPSPADPG